MPSLNTPTALPATADPATIGKSLQITACVLGTVRGNVNASDREVENQTFETRFLQL